MKLMWSLLIAGLMHLEARAVILPQLNYVRNPYYLSKGFTLGYIIDFQRSGLIIHSYEGFMNLGFGTSKGDVYEENCKKDCFIFTNPWRFSTLADKKYRQYLKLGDQRFAPVLVYYVRPIFSFQHAITDTKNFIEGIYPINAKLPIADSYTIPDSKMPIASWLNVAKGSISGRIVHASLDHIFRKSFEVIIQEGGLGNNFRRMSVSDQGMFDYIVHTMQTGKSVHIGFVELTETEEEFLRIGKHYDSPYRVYHVEIQKELPK